jgi:VanZ family protein
MLLRESMRLTAVKFPARPPPVTLTYERAWRAGAGVLVALVVAASLAPAANLPATGISDKTSHLAGYAALALWFAPLFPRRRLPVAAGLIALGAGLEVVQPLASDRLFEWWDMVANAAGVTIGMLLAALGCDRWMPAVDRGVARALARRDVGDAG